MKKQILKKAIAIAAVAASLAAYAVPTIIVTDGVVSSGPITGAGGSVVYINPSFGSNSWQLVITTATTKPIFGSAGSPNMELDIQASSTGASTNELTVIFSDTDFGPTSGRFAALMTGHAINSSGGTVTFNTYYDASNNVTATTTPLTVSGGLPGPSYFTLNQDGSIIGAPFSLTEVVTISGTPAASYSLGANLQALSLACAGGTGQVGTPYSSTLVVSGGCSPYTFSIISGSLPPGLTLNPTTGAITGIPTQPGSFPYVAQVTDCAGRTADTANESCVITIGSCNGQIGDFVWNDVNGNGCQDAGEPGIPGVTVSLYSGACGSSGTLVATTTTDNTGHYLFVGLCPGDYQVAITTPGGYTATTPNQGCKDNSQPPFTADRDSKCNCAGASPCITCVTLTAANPVNLNVDCGYVCNGQIGDFVWYDANGNGCQDAGEPGIPGVKVDLYSGSCGGVVTHLATTTTDNSGHYLFSGLCPGNYQVAITTPAGLAATTPNKGCKDNTQPPYTADRDSKCDCGGGSPCVTCVTLTSGNPVNLNVDCGYVCNGQIGDFVWNDVNGNGCQDAGELGIPNVQVTLWSGACGFGGNQVATTLTDNSGHYLFGGLCAGDYFVSFTTPAGFTATKAHQACALNGTDNSRNQTDSKCDCSGASPCCIPVSLTPVNPVNLNVDCGYVCNGQIGDFVWYDANGNGCQDAGEPGIVGVQVSLYSGACGSAGTLVATTTTDNTGHYLFSGLCAGAYQVAITTPAGLIATTPNKNCKDTTQPPFTADRDSKCDCAGASPCITCVTLTAANPVNLNVDCGYVCNGQIGDFVWSDLNGNGCQDAGEPGIPNVQVTLWTGVCGNGGTQVATTLTDSTGHYLFSGLCAGDYFVSFTTPAGSTATKAHQACALNGTDNSRNQTDSKCDCSGASPCCIPVSITPANPVNLNIDCGYVCNGQIGDFVWQDLNGNGCQDVGEPGIVNVKVDLYSGACGVPGTLIATTFTDNTGHYLFSGLCPGAYQVAITTPAGFTATTPNVGCKDNTQPPFTTDRDSKCNCAGASPCITCVTLTTANPVNLNVDCGYIPQSPNLTLSKSADKSFVLPGGLVTYTYVVKNTGGITVTNVTVVDDNGTPGYTADDVTVGTIASLAPGASQTFTFTDTLPQTECETINGTNVVVGLVLTTILPSGDIQVTYIQQAVNDNRYGTGATAATGWPSGHTFNNLVGSDKCEFRFTDGKGNVVFDFFCDYITASAGFPSGYGCLGLSGGDGSLVSGNAANLLSATTSLSDNFNKAGSPFKTGFFVNSPLETSPNSGISVPAGWDYNNSYTVVVSKNAFGANGFGGVSFPLIHDSPPKLGSNNAVTPTNCNSCVVNVAVVTGKAGTVTLTASATAQVCFGTPPPPSIIMSKTADKTVIDPAGDTVTYTYTVMNTGGQTVNNISVIDDNGTPGNTADDFVVGTIASLAPGASATLTATRFVVQPQQPITMCETINGTNVTVGLVTTTVLASGDIKVTYLQQAVNDNRYGTGATAATGWPSGHTFNNLVGSDKCEFRFTDGKGNVVFDFFCDYITASAGFPSGYGCLGLSGGDGSLVSGNAANLLSATTSLSDNFNKAGSPFKTGFFVNSPLETSPNSGISVPAGWDYNNSYTVVVSKNAFGANGFGGVSFPLIHDSPAKLGGNAVTPTNCNSCLVNIATAVGSAGATAVSASASAQVCFATPPPPSMTLIKTADKTVIDPIGDTVTYTYTVMNTGGRTIANITVTDDNGTPGNTADDFVVGTIASLAPGASATLTATRNLVPLQQPITMCETINGTNVVVGLVTTTVLGSGDIQVTYLQQAVNDNRYGTGATAATGWPSGHTFNNLVGSDKCEFRFTDGLGNVVFDFFCDYITASAAFPSGYGCLGLSGGDGSLVSGNAANLLSATTSLSDNFNKAGSPFKTGFFVNSPLETSPNSGISVPAGWDYNNSYTVVVSKNAFGANGFGGVSFPLIHDSPAKLGGNAVTPTNCNSCVVNIATAVGSAGATALSASASAQVCFGTGTGTSSCSLAPGALKADKNHLQYPIKNTGSQPVFLTEVGLSWPSANGKLKKVSLSGDIWGGPAAVSPVDLTTADFDAFNIDTNHRKINPGQTLTLQFEFEKNASNNTALYSGTVKFGTDASCVLTFP